MPEWIEYDLGGSRQVLELSRSVLERFHRFRQVRPWQKEAGGQLFARLAQSRVVVVEATGPRRNDRRTRTSYIPDRAAEQREIDEMHSRGLHYVGDWHTHPERYASSSCPDVTSIADCFARSKHHLNALVLIVVGSRGVPDGLHVAIHNATAELRLLAKSRAAHGGDTADSAARSPRVVSRLMWKMLVSHLPAAQRCPSPIARTVTCRCLLLVRCGAEGHAVAPLSNGLFM